MWKLASFFLGDFSIAKVIALVAIAAALTAGLIATIEGLASTIAVSLPSEAVAFSVAVLPTNLSACISVVAVARIARWVYDWNITFAKTLAS